MTASVGTTPPFTYRHNATRSLRATATIMILISGDQGQHRLQAKSQLTESLQSGTPCKADLLIAINSYPAGLHGAETKIPHSPGWRGSRRTGPIFSGAAASRPGQI